MEQKMLSKRIDYIDYLRGFAIILVIIGHSSSPELMKLWLYSFHMPLFFFISGLCFSEKSVSMDFKDYFIKKSKTILMPLLFFSLINILYYIITNIYNFTTLYPIISDNVCDKLLGLIVQKRLGAFRSCLWFLPCIFITELMMFYLVKTKQKLMIIAFALLIIGNIIISSLKISLPWNIETSFIGIFFLILGFKSRNYIDKIKEYGLYILPFAFLFSIMTIYLNYELIGEQTDLCRGIIGNLLYYVTSAISGIAICIIIFTKVKNNNFLLFIGKNTLVFYSVHQIILSIESIIIKHAFHTNIHILTHGTSIRPLSIWTLYLIICIFSCVLISFFINKYMPFILGKRL